MKLILLLVLLFASHLAAASYAPPGNRYDIVGGGRYVYVQLDYKIDDDDWKALPASYKYKQSGLYLRDRPDKPIWLGTLRLRWFIDAEPIVSDDGQVISVLRGGSHPRVEFYRSGRQTIAWDLRSARPLRRSATALGYQDLVRWQEKRGVIEVQSRVGDVYRFLLRNGQMVFRDIAGSRLPTQAEMDAFEEALAGGN